MSPVRVVKLMLIGPKAKLLAAWPSLAVGVVPAKSVNWNKPARLANTVSEVAVPCMQCTLPVGACVPSVTLGGLVDCVTVPFFQRPYRTSEWAETNSLYPARRLQKPSCTVADVQSAYCAAWRMRLVIEQIKQNWYEIAGRNLRHTEAYSEASV